MAHIPTPELLTRAEHLAASSRGALRRMRQSIAELRSLVAATAATLAAVQAERAREREWLGLGEVLANAAAPSVSRNGHAVTRSRPMPPTLGRIVRPMGNARAETSRPAAAHDEMVAGRTDS